MNFQVKELWIYPIKSCKGRSMSAVELDHKGFKNDRRFMITDANYRFLTQRDHSSMCLIETNIVENYLNVNAPGMPLLKVPHGVEENQLLKVKIWNDETTAHLVNDESDAWFSKFLGVECHLVYMAEKANRMVDARFAINGSTQSFTDDFPLLIISQASLDDLNTRLVNQITMNRFRPNIVVSGTMPFEEDKWKKIEIGNVAFNVVKPCARCIMTTINQETGNGGGNEPLKTLSTYRMVENKILFGQNIIHQHIGTIELGNNIEVIY